MRTSRVFALALAAAACSDTSATEVAPEENIDPENPRWRFEVVDHGTGDTSFTDAWSNARGDVFIVGWYGTIITNRGGRWREMSVPTTENLTSIAGLNNGRRFGLEDNADGEMFAVGWNGTVLYYHPDPNLDGDPADGEWRKIAGLGGDVEPLFNPVTRIDPACPDFDGDGIPDDGNGDGWSGNFGGTESRCVAGQTAGCDDNCRTTPNGTLRPLRDTNNVGIDEGCLGPGDMADTSEAQLDVDADGIGLVCDDDDSVIDPLSLFTATLFDLHVERDDDALTVVAVGESGAVLSFLGSSNSAVARGDIAESELEDVNNWTAQQGIPFRFSTDDDCGSDPTLGGCGGRLYPSCPAQCNPRKTTCDCLPEDGQCCDPGASTGVGCVGGVDSCGPVANACGGDGICTTLCPDCFRRMEETLRSVAVSNNRITAVGSSGTVVTLDVGATTLMNPLMETWLAPSCATPDPPLDENPLLTTIDADNGAFFTAGAAGAVFALDFGQANCPAASIRGVPPGFVSDIEAVGGGRAFAVGDNGLFVELRGGNVTFIPTGITENLLGVRRSRYQDAEGENITRYWLVGATGRIVRAGFF